MNEDESVVKSTKRTGKEIKLKGSLFNNSNLKFKIGTIEEKHSPSTIYIESTFWIDLKDKKNYSDKYSFFDYNFEITKKLSNYLKNIYKKDLNPLLNNNEVFPLYLDNIFVYDFPEKINYNTKRSFVSIELSLHTLNILENVKNKLPLNNKKDNIIYQECLKICDIISNCDLLKGKLEFDIFNSKRDKKTS